MLHHPVQPSWIIGKDPKDELVIKFANPESQKVMFDCVLVGFRKYSWEATVWLRRTVSILLMLSYRRDVST